jgi:acetyl esterase/lipase
LSFQGALDGHRTGVTDWRVDDRPAHVYTRAYVAGMWARRDKSAFEGAEQTLRKARDKQAAGDAPPTRWTRLRRRVVETRWDGMQVWRVGPRGGTAPVVRVVYFHGGGYVHPLTKDYWRLVRALTSAPDELAVEVVLPAYPLAPDATVDEVLPQLVALVQSLDGEDEGDGDSDAVPTVLMGDSAGGALVLAVAARLRESDDVRRPARLVLLSPWLDATLDERRVADLEASDPMLAESGLRAAGRWWAGDRDPADPLVSPVNADLHDLPPTDLFIGQHDILRPAVDDLVEHADRDGLELRIHEVTAMFHVWMTRAIPEAARTRHELRAILREVAGRQVAADFR